MTPKLRGLLAVVLSSFLSTAASAQVVSLQEPEQTMRLHKLCLLDSYGSVAKRNLPPAEFEKAIVASCKIHIDAMWDKGLGRIATEMRLKVVNMYAADYKRGRFKK